LLVYIAMIFNSHLVVFLGCLSAVIAQTSVNCGIKGYDKGKNLAYLVNGTVLTASGCKNLCAASTKCASFAVGTSACLLYNVTVAVNVNSVNTSSYTFYDAACPIS
jgi:hypothetical protein